MGPSAAFFDLDKTVIAKSSALAFGRPFYRDGLISRRDMVKSVYAQLMFRLGGADEQTMARVSLELGSRGTVHYETLSAIPVDDFIASL